MKSIVYTTGTLILVLVCSFHYKKPKIKVSQTVKMLQKKLPEAYIYIPEGKTSVHQDTVSLSAFFMLKTEITNFHYLEYIYDLKRSGNSETYTAALPDTAKWNSKNGMHSKFVDYYFRHPAFRNYPVVNVSQQQAQNYAKWVEGKLRTFTGNNQIIVRLPWRNEFLRAANGNDMKRMYAWQGSDLLRNKLGQIMCNHLNLSNENITLDPETGAFSIVRRNVDSEFITTNGQKAGYKNSDNADVCAPVESYFKSDLGFYNLNGNVSEWVMEKDMAVGGDWSMPGYDVRNESYKTVKNPAPTTGFRLVIELPKE